MRAGSEPDVGLGEQEGRDVVRGHLGQPLALLLLGAVGLQRLRQPDRLMGRQQRRDRRVPGPGQRQRPVVVDLRQPQASVLLGDLHSQRPEVLEALDDVVAELAVLLDLQRIDALGQEGPQARQELLALADPLGIDLGLGVDQVEPKVTEVHAAAEARELPLGLPAVLGDLL